MSAYFVAQDAQLYSLLDTMVISGEDVSCRIVFDTLVSVSVLNYLSFYVL